VVKWLGGEQAATLVAQAVLEGAAVLNAVLMLVDDQLWHLAPIAILLAGLAMLTPTTTKVLGRLELAVREAR
jgi:hypothetical protein